VAVHRFGILERVQEGDDALLLVQVTRKSSVRSFAAWSWPVVRRVSSRSSSTLPGLTRKVLMKKIGSDIDTLLTLGLVRA
jgi:hypothetical protein